MTAPTSTLDPKTLAGEYTPELRLHLLERRWAYMHRKVKQPLIRVWDKDMNFIARVDGLAEKWDWEEIATEDGEAHVSFKGKQTDWLREIVAYQIDDDEDVHVTIDPDPDNPHDFWVRWGGKVLTIEGEDNAGEASSFVLNCVSNRRHLSGIYLAATPITPMEFQPLKMFMWGGPTCSTAAFATWINLFRLQTLNGFYPIPRNVFAPETYLENVSPLNWAIQVMPVVPLLDQSRWCTLAARWKDAHTVLSPIMRDARVICRAYTWLPGDPAPYAHVFGPELGELLKPTRACVILSFENKSGVTGPTGTMADGALNLFAATLDDMITETVIPVDTNRDYVEGEAADPFFRKLLLVAPKPPAFVYRDVGYGNVRKAKWVIHKSQATDIIVGGKSPQWVNMAITFAIRYAISQLAQVVLGQEAPGVEGLDNLYQGQLDDVFLAFQRFTNPLRSAKAGPYAFREYHKDGSGSAYTVNAIQDIASGEHEMKPYRSMKFDVGDGQPYILGQDFWLGDRVSAEIRGVQYTDWIYAIKATGDRTTAGRPEVSFGDDSREEDPIARGFRTISNVANFAGLLAGSGDMF